MKNAKNIKAAELQNLTVIGHFEGECADANITNKNGLDITKDVWENVFASDDYKQAIDLGWYIGFLGHPEDPNCMDFEHACIVMKSGRIDSNGKIYGEFDLIDTPVGRIVKSFIDAGVTFGISVRGAGDIVDNSVDPDTFIFRGFDLVTFPAYPEAIPTFTEVAASSDISTQKKYKAVCAAVKKNIDGLNTPEAVEIVQSQFAKQSDEYKILESKRKELIDDSDVDDDPDSVVDISDEQLDGIMALYLDKVKENESLCATIKSLESKLKIQASEDSRRLRSVNRIMSSQMKDLVTELDSVSASYKTIQAATSKLKDQNIALKDSNLKYKRRIQAASDTISEQQSTISKLRSDFDETVSKMSTIEASTSNLDATIATLKRRLDESECIIQEYQDAYASIYANAIGVNAEGVQVTASMHVPELQQKISACVSVDHHSDITESNVIDFVDSDNDDTELVTL